MTDLKICFCGGGTGGHLNPLIAIYKQLNEQEKTNSIFLLPESKLESELSKTHSLPVCFFRFAPMHRGWIALRILRIFGNLIQAIQILTKNEIDCVVGSGGYTSFPVFLAAVILKVPLILIEPNLVVGKVNQWFIKTASLVFVPSKQVAQDFSYDEKKISEQAVFPSLAFLDSDPLEECQNRVLVFGASQGAASINEFIRLFLNKYPEYADRFYWITGISHYQELENRYPGLILKPFSHQMGRLLRSCDLVICRAGAGTVNEVQYFKVPALFVPYPHHKDRQQFKNCANLVSSGAGLLWEEEGLFERLAELKHLIDNPKILKQMRAKFPDTSNKNPAQLFLSQIRSSINKL